MATVPDFGALVGQQKQADDEASQRSTWASRPDQNNALGSITWNQDASGRWINSSNLNGGAQNLFNTTIGGQQNLANQLGGGLNSDGLMGWGNSDLDSGLMGWGNTDLTRGAVAMPDSGFGASQQVIDAWNALQQPGLDKAAQAARARASAMGLTMGSNAWGATENTIGTNARNAANEGILRGTQEYQNVFNRGMASRQQTVAENAKQAELMNSMRNQQYGERKGEAELMNAMRNQQFGERSASYDRALSGSQALTGIRDSLNVNKWAQTVPTATAYKPQQILGAALETFNANRANENADIAQRNANINSGIGAVNALGGLGGITSGLGSLATGAGNVWDWGKNLYNSWGGNQSAAGGTYGLGGMDAADVYGAGSGWGQDIYPGNQP